MDGIQFKKLNRMMISPWCAHMIHKLCILPFHAVALQMAGKKYTHMNDAVCRTISFALAFL